MAVMARQQRFQLLAYLLTMAAAEARRLADEERISTS
jgi:hypothetical protein